MRSSVSGIIAAGGRASLALLLSAAMAFGGAPAVALAEGAQVQNAGSEQTVLGDQTSTVNVPYDDGGTPVHDVEVDGDITVTGTNESWEKGAVVGNYGYAQPTDNDNLTVTGDVSATNTNEGSMGAIGVTVQASGGANA